MQKSVMVEYTVHRPNITGSERESITNIALPGQTEASTANDIREMTT